MSLSRHFFLLWALRIHYCHQFVFTRVLHIIRLFKSNNGTKKILLQQNERNTKIISTFITIVLYFNALNYQWRILLRRSGLAEGYTMRPYTVPLDRTAGSVFATLKSMNFFFSFVIGVLYAEGHLHRLAISHRHVGDDSNAMWEVRRLQGAQTADK